MATPNPTEKADESPERTTASEAGARCGSMIADKYLVERLLGRGGMGAVYQATHTAIGKRVALKFLERDIGTDRNALARFQREAEAASQVESAHIVQIFDSGTTHDGVPFLVMELLQGEDLRARLRREGRLELAEAVHLTGQVLRGLARAHAAHIVHRDLKPDNVYLCERDDDPMFVKIVDFGISKFFRQNMVDTLTRRGTVLGTAFYMSPEQAQALGDVDGKADLYSLGAILYECLAGRPPHTGTTYEAVLISICTTDAPDVRTHAPDVPEPVASVLRKALERDRSARYQSALEFYDALAQAAPGMLRTGQAPIAPARDSARPATSDRPAADTVELRVLTPEGAAVPGTSSTTPPRKRSLFVAALAGAVAVLVVLLIFRQTAEQPAREAGSARLPDAVSVKATAEAERRAAPTERGVEPSSEPAPATSTTSADVAPVRSAPSASVKRVAASPKGRPMVQRRIESAQSKSVAGSLELNTRGP